MAADGAANGGATGGRSRNGEGDGPPVFRGLSRLALDAKGRLAVPTRHREALDGNGAGLVVTADPSQCLLLYPRAAWEPIQARLMGLSSFDPRMRGLQRLIVGHADDVEIDAAGRILVPPPLRQYARLDKHVVLVGQGHKFELWDEAAWQAQTAQVIAFGGTSLPSELDGFSL